MNEDKNNKLVLLDREELREELNQILKRYNGVSSLSENDTYLSIDEAVQFLRISKSAVYQLRCQGKIKAGKVGKYLRFKKTDLINYIENSIK